MNLILGVAQRDERIRAIVTGSRANPMLPRICFRIMMWFSSWKKPPPSSGRKTGFAYLEICSCPEPDKNDRLDVNGDFDRSYTYLMLFADGNRLDLRLQTKEAMREEYGKDKLAVPLMDKDGFLPSVPLRQSTTS